MSDLLVPFTLRLPDASLRDCAASQGTPLSEALDSLGVDPSWVHLCRVSGSSVKPTDRVGVEVAAGDVIMFVADPSAMLSHQGWPFRSPHGSSEAEADSPSRARAVSAGTLVGSALVVVLVEVFVLASPFVWGWQPDPVSRLAFGSLSVFYALVLGYIAPAWARTECVAAASLVFGLACLQIVPADNPVGSAVAPIVVTWGGLLYCLSYGVRRVEGVEDAISVPRAAWAVATVCATLMILGNSLVAHPAFLAIAAGAALVWLSPQLTVRAGSFVLIDIGEVMTVALPGRQQEPPKPKAMNARASHEAYASARVRSHVVVALACLLCVLGGMGSGAYLGTQEWHGRAALATIVGGALSLGFAARGQRGASRMLLIASSAALASAVAASAGVTAGVPGGSAALLSCAAFLLVALFLVRDTRKKSASPLAGRLLDVLQAFAMVVVLPSSVYASGLFDAIRQAV